MTLFKNTSLFGLLLLISRITMGSATPVVFDGMIAFFDATKKEDVQKFNDWSKQQDLLEKQRLSRELDKHKMIIRHGLSIKPQLKKDYEEYLHLCDLADTEKDILKRDVLKGHIENELKNMEDEDPEFAMACLKIRDIMHQL